MDIDTPVHDETDATEIQSRLTMPIFQGRLRKSQVEVARRQLDAAIAAQIAEMRRRAAVALTVAIRTAYLQQQLALDQQRVELTAQIAQLSSPGQRSGDAAAQLVDYADALADAQQAADALFDTTQELALSRVGLAEAIGIDLTCQPDIDQRLTVEYDLTAESLELPPLNEVITVATTESAELRVVRAELRREWSEYHAVRNRPLPMEVGPRYQDRLGRADDTIGFRVATEIPIGGEYRSELLRREIAARRSTDQLSLEQRETVAEIVRDYRELEAIIARLAGERMTETITEQEAILADPDVAASMTGIDQALIRLSVIRQQQELLRLRYRLAELRAGLPATESYSVYGNIN